MRIFGFALDTQGFSDINMLVSATQHAGIGGYARGATPHHLTPDVWAQFGGKWVLF